MPRKATSELHHLEIFVTEIKISNDFEKADLSTALIQRQIDARNPKTPLCKSGHRTLHLKEAEVSDASVKSMK